MKYRILEIEITETLPALQLDPDESGFALLVRHRGKPVGFHMQASAPGQSWSSARIGQLAAGAAAEAIVTAKVLEAIDEEPTLTTPPSLTIAVCTRDRDNLLTRCLEGIHVAIEASADVTMKIDVLVVDNAPSNDRTRRTVERFADARYVVEACAGLDFARNTAWRSAHGDFVAYIDDDACLDKNWVRGFIRAAARHPDAGAFTGLVLPLALDSEAQIQFENRGGWRHGFVPLRYAGSERINDPYYPVGAGIFGAGCNMVIRRSLLAELGGFDEALDTGPPLPGGGDLDIFYRVVRSGAPLVYDPDLAVFHEHRREIDGLRHQYYSWGLGFQAFLTKTLREDPGARRKVSGIRRWWVLYLLYLLFSGLVPPRMVLAEVAGGIVGYFGGYERSRARVAAIRGANQ